MLTVFDFVNLNKCMVFFAFLKDVLQVVMFIITVPLYTKISHMSLTNQQCWVSYF